MGEQHTEEQLENSPLLCVQDDFPDITFRLETTDGSGKIDGVLRLLASRYALDDHSFGRPGIIFIEKAYPLGTSEETLAKEFREMARKVRDDLLEDAKKKIYEPNET